ncbi:MAG: type II toxin-antitoxin system mRNA interferase toxin, RelE/StbE family [Patescibacteria group bacterium]|nr:type II toxin-antitoxin system mRNA interferase toxin, RelE/StbE family [Patescibacteria group bacterium]
MKISYHKNFLKHYQTRILPNSKLIAQFKQRLELFLKNPQDPLLKDHLLIGNKSSYRAFSITGDIRVIYQTTKDGVLLYDIGSHNQVY